ncbi:hypothetical protein R3I94_019622 [Phoxinus phoxinus]
MEKSTQLMQSKGTGKRNQRHRFMSACNHSEQGVSFCLRFLCLNVFCLHRCRGKPHVSLKKLKVAYDKTVNPDGEAFMFEKTMFYVFKFSLNICGACCVVYAFEVWNHHSCPKRSVWSVSSTPVTSVNWSSSVTHGKTPSANRLFNCVLHVSETTGIPTG